MAQKLTKLTFAFEKETKGTFRFKEVEQDFPVVGTLYVKRSAFNDKAPAEITVDITVTKE